MNDLLGYLRIQAHANRLANLRLHAAMAPLTREALHAPRVSFFPTLIGTLQHILAVDVYYIAGLYREADMAQQYHRLAKHDTLATLAPAQAAADQRLIDFCDALTEHTLQADVVLERGDTPGERVQRDRCAQVLAHLFNHQVHHRGQVHAMLAGTEAKPPQLDEFMMPSEAHLRTTEMATLGWDEATVYRR